MGSGAPGDGDPGDGDAGAGLAPRAATEAGAPRTRVLVVDDRAEIRAACLAVLREAGYQVREARDGEEALRRAAAWPPDLALLDAAMPGLSGPATFEALSRSQPQLRAVFMSGFSDETLAGLEPSGRWTFLPKPFDAAGLLAAVSRVLAPVADLAS